MDYEDAWVEKLTENIGMNLQRNEYEAIRDYSASGFKSMSDAVRLLIFSRMKGSSLKPLHIKDDDLRVGVYRHFRLSLTKSQYDALLDYADSNDLTTTNAVKSLIFENPTLKKRGRRNHGRTHRLMVQLSEDEYRSLRKRFGNYQMAEGIRRVLFK